MKPGRQLQNFSTLKIALLGPLEAALSRLPFWAGHRQRGLAKLCFASQENPKSSIFRCRGVLQLPPLIFLLTFILFAFSISKEDANRIGEKIWKNECRGTVEGLTNWKKGENFASVGIGHFIWYSVGKKERFEEMFPELLAFLESQGIVLPTWLKNVKGCPWNSQ